MREVMIAQINAMMADLPDETIRKLYRLIQRIWKKS